MQDPQQTLVPMMDVDLMWHTHMGIANAYHNDMYALLGDKRLNHDDGIEEGHRVNSFQRTKEAYEARFPHMGPYNPAPTQVRHTAAVGCRLTRWGCALVAALPQRVVGCWFGSRATEYKESTSAACERGSPL